MLLQKFAARVAIHLTRLFWETYTSTAMKSEFRFWSELTDRKQANIAEAF